MDLKSFMIKGAPMLADIEFIRKEHGENGLKRVLAAMPPEIAKVYRRVPLAGSWYTMETRVAILEAANKEFAKNCEDYFFVLGCYQAEHNLNSYYKAFMRMIGPKKIMKMAKVFWGLIYKNSRIEVTAGEKSFSIEVIDYPKTGEYNCHAIRGYLYRTAEISGAEKRNLRGVELACIHRGDNHCKFSFEWD